MHIFNSKYQTISFTWAHSLIFTNNNGGVRLQTYRFQIQKQGLCGKTTKKSRESTTRLNPVRPSWRTAFLLHSLSHCSSAVKQCGQEMNCFPCAAGIFHDLPPFNPNVETTLHVPVQYLDIFNIFHLLETLTGYRTARYIP